MKKTLLFLFTALLLPCMTVEKAESKIAINIEGVVIEVKGNKVTLDNGKTIIITDQTVFETENVGRFIPVNDKILVGNYIQGFTLGNPSADEVTADFINSNGVLEKPTNSVIVNIEGTIVEVSDDGKKFLLNTGKWVIVTSETKMGIDGPNAAPKDKQLFEKTFRVGNSIAGFTENENANEVIAYAIYTNWNWGKDK